MKFKFNIPNNITLIRVGLIPVFVVVLLAHIPYKNILSAFIFGMLSVSDILDGYFARKKKQITEFGKLIDPIADKLLISTALIILIGRGVELWMAVAIIAREIILTAVRIYLLPSRIVIPASNFGKSKTVVQSIAIVFVLLQLPYSWHVMLVAVLITLISGLEYLYRIRKMTGNKVVNLPNIITLARFLMIIPFVYYMLTSQLHIALLIFAAVAVSDKLDGISARLMNQKTELGSGFDSFTDWTLIILTFFLMAARNYISFLWVTLIIVPSAVSGIMKMVYAKKQQKVPVTLVARLSVGLTYMTSIVLLIRFGFGIQKLAQATEYLIRSTILLIYVAMASYVHKTMTMPHPLKKEKNA